MALSVNVLLCLQSEEKAEPKKEEVKAPSPVKESVEEKKESTPVKPASAPEEKKEEKKEESSVPAPEPSSNANNIPEKKIPTLEADKEVKPVSASPNGNPVENSAVSPPKAD